MVEVLATIADAAKELFDYNRESFKFDQGQKLLRDLLRVEMQIKRFELFREDIRDLVELTVGKMEMYHLVGALFLEFCVALYCEGRIHASAPPFILGLYYLSVGGAFTYLVLAVWLSMHASISSHSFGVRLLTRFVRLPIPGAQEINALNARLAEFEKQNAGNMMRMPIVGPNTQRWRDRTPAMPPVAESFSLESPGNGAMPHVPPAIGQDHLGQGEATLGNPEDVLKPIRSQPAEHVRLYRRLQSKWQCYDAYARVCMALGANQILNALSFYIINVTIIEYRSPSACFAIVAVFQFAALGLSFLDIAKLGHGKIILIQLVGTTAPVLSMVLLSLAHRDAAGVMDHTASFPESPITFLFMALWLECLLYVAWPSQDSATLPRRFRAVLFLDVFGEALDPTDEEDVPSYVSKRALSMGTGMGSVHLGEAPITAEQASGADDAVSMAQAALRRWQAVPEGAWYTEAQQQQLRRLRVELAVWSRALNAEAARRAARSGVQAGTLLEEDNRTWAELSAEEREEDPLSGWLLGPFQDQGAQYFFDLEAQNFVRSVPPGQALLALEQVAGLVSQAETEVRAVIGETYDPARGHHHFDSSSGASSSDDGEVGLGRRRAQLRSRSVVGRAQALVWFCCGKQSRELREVDDYVPQRLPWVIVHSVTRAVQVAWTFVGVMTWFDVSLAPPESYITEPVEPDDRRLKSSIFDLDIETLEVRSWPQGRYFRPELLAILPSEGDLLVGSPYAHYRAGTFWNFSMIDAPVAFTALPGPRLPRGTLALCAGSSTASADNDSEPVFGSSGSSLGGSTSSTRSSSKRSNTCFAGVLSDGELALWPWGRSPSTGHHVSVPSSRRPWRLFAGALMPCKDVQLLLRAPASPAKWCFLLAGWDGERIPVAALPVRQGPDVRSGDMATIDVAFDVPLVMDRPEAREEARAKGSQAGRNAATAGQRPGTGGADAVCREGSEGAPTGGLAVITALHVQPGRGWLWAVVDLAEVPGATELVAWDLLQPRMLGRWRLPHSSDLDGFRAAALSSEPSAWNTEADSDVPLLLAGMSGATGPRLLRTVTTPGAVVGK